MALCEVAYADALLPLFDAVEVVRSQWEFVDEKVYGVVDRVSAHAEYYTVCEPQVMETLPLRPTSLPAPWDPTLTSP